MRLETAERTHRVLLPAEADGDTAGVRIQVLAGGKTDGIVADCVKGGGREAEQADLLDKIVHRQR
jgi:hypothetical protein